MDSKELHGPAGGASDGQTEPSRSTGASGFIDCGGWHRIAATPNIYDAAEMLWVVLANVSGGDWTKQSPDWRHYAARWRDYYFDALKAGAAGRNDE